MAIPATNRMASVVDDEDDLVGRSKRLHCPVLERQRNEVDHLVAHGDDWRHGPVDGAHEQLACRQPRSRREDTDDRTTSPE